MKYLLVFIASLSLYNHSFAQNDSTLYYFEEVGMFIKVASTFEVVQASEDEELKAKGEKLLESANNVEIDISSTINLLSIRQGRFNYMNITATPFRKSKRDWEQNTAMLRDMLYKSFADKVAPGAIDTAGSVIEVDGLPMEKFSMTIMVTDSVTMKMLLLSKNYKGFDFGICYVFVDDKVGQQFDRMVQSASFKK